MFRYSSHCFSYRIACKNWERPITIWEIFQHWLAPCYVVPNFYTCTCNYRFAKSRLIVYFFADLSNKYRSTPITSAAVTFPDIKYGAANFRVKISTFCVCANLSLSLSLSLSLLLCVCVCVCVWLMHARSASKEKKTLPTFLIIDRDTYNCNVPSGLQAGFIVMRPALIGDVTTFRHPSRAYICQMPGHRLSRLAKDTHSESRLSISTIGFGWNCFLLCRLCTG